ncbi:hypothetical protein CBR_g16989 [Chara braunii]|uniref:Uncharacterized protein n=1 Tax=Chara braunii TaxID=69332 RepID=A0A388KUB9_CHABU|nr:hypothetical protein CBR_g16989 [Chara braunii]|eukprot:GBG73646.1 hypothetical protein CBR_g16989 [Chara braunii]
MEMTLCYIVVAIFYVAVISKGLVLSADFDYGKRAGVLPGQRPGWMFGRQIDLSDTQWRTFRNNLPVLSALLGLLVTLGELLRRLCPKSTSAQTFFWFKCSVFTLLYMHGACIVFVFLFAGLNFALVKACAGNRWYPPVLWVFNCALLLSSRLHNGYSFALMLGSEFAYLDGYRGGFRWEICYNFLMLRMISFGMDFHWSLIKRPSPVDLAKHKESCEVCSGYVGGIGGGGRGGGGGGGRRLGGAEESAEGQCYLARQEGVIDLKHFNLMKYLCYLFFTPLYIAGPISSYGAFVSHLESRQTAHSQWKLLQLFLRYAACFALMELITHFTHFNALAISMAWQSLSPFEVFAIGYGVLNFMWLKFLLIWRFFRLWALVAGFDVPDNMLRCVNNNYDLEGFWKNWHASFNRWIVRYIYIPLGGAASRGTNVWLIFTFVALWHDLDWRLLTWAWMTCVLSMPEISVKLLMKSEKMRWVKDTWMYREACAVCGALNITGLMGANLVGFVIGPDGLQTFGAKFLTRQSVPLIGGIFVAFYAGTKVMFDIREREARRQSALREAIGAKKKMAGKKQGREADRESGKMAGKKQGREAGRESGKMAGVVRAEGERDRDGKGEDHHHHDNKGSSEKEQDEEERKMRKRFSMIRNSP